MRRHWFSHEKSRGRVSNGSMFGRIACIESIYVSSGCVCVFAQGPSHAMSVPSRAGQIRMICAVWSCMLGGCSYYTLPLPYPDHHSCTSTCASDQKQVHTNHDTLVLPTRRMTKDALTHPCLELTRISSSPTRTHAAYPGWTTRPVSRDLA